MKDIIGDDFPVPDDEPKRITKKISEKQKKNVEIQNVVQTPKDEEEEFTVEKFLANAPQLEGILNEHATRIRKLLATTSTQKPEDIFDVVARLGEMNEKIKSLVTPGSKSESTTSLIDLLNGAISLVKNLDKESVGKVLKSIGEALSGEKSEK